MIIFINNNSIKFCQITLHIKRFIHKRKVVASNHQFYYLTGKHKTFTVNVAAKFSTRTKINTKL